MQRLLSMKIPSLLPPFLGSGDVSGFLSLRESARVRDSRIDDGVRVRAAAFRMLLFE